MGCRYLTYVESAQDQSFEELRAYCEAADRLVQPMRADICNDRYSLHHTSDCEIYLTATERKTSDPSQGEGTDQ